MRNGLRVVAIFVVVFAVVLFAYDQNLAGFRAQVDNVDLSGFNLPDVFGGGHVSGQGNGPERLTDDTHLVGIGELMDYASKHEGFIAEYDWDEQNAHQWKWTVGLYAPSSMYADTSISGSATYILDDDFSKFIGKGFDGLWVIVTGTTVDDLTDNVDGGYHAFMGAYPLTSGMKFFIADGSISIVQEQYAQGETCARTQLSVIDYGPASIQWVDVPDGWQCSNDELAAGLFRDPTRHVARSGS